MIVHVICPFYRIQMLPTLLMYLEPMNIIWHPICDTREYEPFKNGTRSWIKPLLVPPLNPGEMVFRKLNDFIDAGDIVDDDYYCIMGDDDMFEPGFFDVIRQQTAKILVNSLYRGDATPTNCHPTGWHPTWPLVMNGLEDMRTCNIGLMMITMKGEILKQTRYGIYTVVEDGIYAENIRDRWPNDIKFLTNLFALGGYFQPGRYNTTKGFKPNWELPKII